MRPFLAVVLAAVTVLLCCHPRRSLWPAPDTFDRGLISVATGDGNFVSWRLLAGDAPGTGSPCTGTGSGSTRRH